MAKFAIGSEGIIGNVKKHYQSLKYKGWEWHSFYNGWIEGRAELSQEIRDGKYISTSENSLHKHGVSGSACDIIEIETTIQLMPRKWWQFHKRGWQKHQDFFGKKYFVRYRWSV